MQKTQQQIYDYFNSLEKCKASGKIIKIVKDQTSDKCSDYYRFKMNNGTKDFILRGTEQKILSSGTGCSDKIYTFSGGQVPKVGDEMHIIGISSYSLIWEMGKEKYDSNTELSDCPIQYDGPPSQYAYLWADKCKVSGKIEEVKKISADYCGFGLQFKVQNNENIYFFNGRESVYFEKVGAYCLGKPEGWFPIVTYSQQGESSTYYPSNGDDIYAILDISNNTILKYGVDNYNANADVPVCAAETNPEKYSSVVGISDAEVKTIMDKAETELKNLDGYTTGAQNIQLPKETTTPVINAEKTVTTEPKTTPISTTTTPKKNTISTSTPKKEEIKQEEVIVSTGSEVKEQVSSGSEIKEEKNEVIVQKAEPIKLGFYNSPDSYILFSGIVVLSVIVYFVFKKLKAKK